MIKFEVVPQTTDGCEMWAVTATEDMGAPLLVWVYGTEAEANTEALRLADIQELRHDPNA